MPKYPTLPANPDLFKRVLTRAKRVEELRRKERKENKACMSALRKNNPNLYADLKKGYMRFKIT